MLSSSSKLDLKDCLLYFITNLELHNIVMSEKYS